MNRKGTFEEIAKIGIPLLFLIIILGIFWVMAVIVPPTVEYTGQIIDGLETGASQISIVQNNPQLNTDFNNTIGKIEVVTDNSPWLVYTFLFISIIVFFVMCFNIRGHPGLGGVWIAFILVTTIAALWITDSYNNIKYSSPQFTQLYQQQAFNDFLMSNIAYIQLIMGFVGGFILFVIYTSDKQSEGVVL